MMHNQDAQGDGKPERPGSVAMPPAEVEPHATVLAEQLAIAHASLGETQEAVARAEAENENIRRRVVDDIGRAHKYAIESFAEAVLPVKDSLETALRIDTPSAGSLKEGVAITLKQLEAAFARNGMQEIKPNPGERVDPQLHRAISMVPAPQSANTIVTVLQKGYLIGDRVLRPALVTVAQEKGPETGPDGLDEPADA